MARLYVYVVDRDFGFAPNPFHGVRTLATCKPGIRNSANVGDWVIGVGGKRLNATGRCIFAMRVTERLTFNQYWTSDRFGCKKPVRNGSKKMLVGDNIYHYDGDAQAWRQADSHHSNSDGSINIHNLVVDTKANGVLVSENFYYFGNAAPTIPAAILTGMGYKNGRNYRVFEASEGQGLLDWLKASCGDGLNCVLGDPFDFDRGEMRYSAGDNRIR